MILPLLRLVVSQLPGWSYATGNAPKPLIWKIGLVEWLKFHHMSACWEDCRVRETWKKTWDLFWHHIKMVWWAGLLNNWIMSMCLSFVLLHWCWWWLVAEHVIDWKVEHWILWWCMKFWLLNNKKKLNYKKNCKTKDSMQDLALYIYIYIYIFFLRAF